MRESYDQLQRQEQRITASLIQGLNMLSLPIQGMYDYLVELSMENPMLEIPEPPALESLEELYSRQEASLRAIERGYDAAYSDQTSGISSAEAEGFDPYYSRGVAFEADELHGSLKLQLSLCRLPPAEYAIGCDIIENLNESGYFVGDLNTICLLYCQKLEIGEKVLNLIHGFSPKGIGGRNVYETLCLQVEDSFPQADLARKIICDDLRAICDGTSVECARKYGVSRVQVEEVFDYIRTLEPRPGNCDSQKVPIQYIQPDIVVRQEDGELHIFVAGETDNPLRLNETYLELMQTQDLSAEDRLYLRSCLNAARSLIHSVDIRRQTIHRAALSLATMQADFFRIGPQALRPLTMQQLADTMGVNVSTVCRVVQGKYVSTPFGIFPMKYFFARALRGAGNVTVTADAARQRIEQMIRDEDTDAPLTDDEICAALNEQGFRLSRRTVSKYRQAAGIPGYIKRKRKR